MSTLSVADRTHLLNTLLQTFAARAQQFLDYVEQHPDALLADWETQAQHLSADCFAPALQVAVEQRRTALEATAALPPSPCGHPRHYKGSTPRTLLTRVGPITIHRGYYYCDQCHQGTYPLDTILGLGVGQFSEGVQQGVCQLAAELPFERAASTWTALSGLPISAREVARLSEARGQRLEATLGDRQAALLAGTDAERPDPDPPQHLQPQGAGIWAVALDAARICFRDDWHEVKAGVVFWAQPRAAEHPQAGAIWDGAEASAQSYVAVTGAMAAAGGRLYLEAIRRGIVPSEQRVVCLGDGAPGNWEQFATHFPKRVEVLDWYHAVEHLWEAGKGLYGAETVVTTEWVSARKTELWEGRVADVLVALRAAEQEATGAAAAKQIGYFETNARRMDYAAYRAAGYPIGSGTVESACKRVVGARAKGAGMRWSKAGVQGVLTLRAELLSGRWAQSWPATRPQFQAA